MKCTLNVADKEINVIFNMHPKITQTAAELYKGGKLISSSPNEIVIELYNFLQSDDKKVNYEYKTSSPYWFFHDLAHAIYTPHVFVPKIIEIPWSLECEMYIQGLVLARKAGLGDEFLSSVPELKKQKLV